LSVSNIIILLAVLMNLSACSAVNEPDANGTMEEPPTSSATKNLEAITIQSWGPERLTTYKWDSSADHPVMNSVVDNPVLGDERSNFVQISVAGTQKYHEEITVEAGKEYEIYIYFHNNASASLNDSGVGMANDVRMSSQFPSKIEAGQRLGVTGVISSSNPDPATVWDNAYIKSNETLYLRYVPGSALIHSSGSVNGINLPADDLFTDNGTPVGYSANYWGSLAGCNEYAGYVTYLIKADHPNFTINTFKNTASVVTGDGVQEDDAVVTVQKR
jgi:hypothetical protein